MDLQEKEAQKDSQHTGNLFFKNVQLSVNSRLKATQIIRRQRKAFYRHRIPQPSCARKETVDLIKGNKKLLKTRNYTDRSTFMLDISGIPGPKNEDVIEQLKIVASNAYIKEFEEK